LILKQRTTGRPRALTEAQIERVLAWHAELQQLKPARKRLGTRRQLAAQLGERCSAT
jgi:hypothetical protein